MSNQQSEKQTNSYFGNDMANSRFAMVEEDFSNTYGQQKKSGFFDRMHASFQNYVGNGKVMLKSSFNHFHSPSTIVVLIVLTAIYVLLTVAQVGLVEFSFRGSKIIHYITTSMDIIVNAVLGFFYGPVVSCVSFLICTVVRMFAEKMSPYPGYIIASLVAGFLHGWILYRHKDMWFGTRFRGFFKSLLAKIFMLRLIVSTFVNIILMSIMHKIFIGYPIHEFILHYSKSKYELKTYEEVLSVFTVSLLFETAVIFIALVVINFIVMKAFPSQMDQPTILIDENGTLINMEEEMLQNMPPDDMM